MQTRSYLNENTVTIVVAHFTSHTGAPSDHNETWIPSTCSDTKMQSPKNNIGQRRKGHRGDHILLTYPWQDWSPIIAPPPTSPNSKQTSLPMQARSLTITVSSGPSNRRQPLSAIHDKWPDCSSTSLSLQISPPTHESLPDRMGFKAGGLTELPRLPTKEK